MAHPSTSRRTAKTISLGCFLIGLAIVAYLKSWWPGIMLVVGLPLAIRQYLLGRRYDVGVTLFVFIGVFVTVQFEISWEILLPVLFTIGGIYIFVREFIEEKSVPEEEEELNQELEEEEHKKKKH
jgi:predicted membrane protein